jgi:positive regulator of sigma E activity
MWKQKLLRAGKIIEIGDKKIKIELYSKTLPSACQAKGCSACKSHSPQIEREYSKSDFQNEVSPGDTVRVETWQMNDGLAATVLFITPLLFAAVFYHIAVVSGISQESILSILIAVFGGISGFGISVIFDKIFRKINPAKIFKE